MNIPQGSGALAIRIAPKYALSFVQTTRWDEVEATLTWPTQREETTRAKQTALGTQLAFNELTPASGYTLVLRFFLGSGSDQKLLSTQHHTLTIQAGQNLVAVQDSAGTPATPSLSLPKSPQAYVSSFGIYGPSARLDMVQGIAYDRQGRGFVMDNGVLRLMATDSLGRLSLTTLAGQSRLGHQDGSGEVARFNPSSTAPTMGLAVADDGTVFIADTGNHVIRAVRFDAHMKATVSTLAGLAGQSGWQDGPANQARFNLPTGLALDNEGVLYIADTSNSRVRRLKADAQGQLQVSTVAGVASTGAQDGPASSAQLYGPSALAFMPDGSLLVSEISNRLLRRIQGVQSASPTVSTVAGTGAGGYLDGPGASATFQLPWGLSVDAQGRAYITDGRVRRVDFAPSGSASVTTIAGVGSGTADGPAWGQRQGQGVTIAPDGAVVVGDQRVIRTLAPDGSGAYQGRCLIGDLTQTVGVVQDGPASYAYTFAPNDMIVDRQGRLVVASRSSAHVYEIQPQRPNTPPVLLAGDGVAGNVDGPGLQARVGVINRMAEDADGNFFAADATTHSIRKFTRNASGGVTVSTYAGSRSMTFGHVDGPADMALFREPSGVAVLPSGDVLVTEARNQTLRRLHAVGNQVFVSTLAGSPTGGTALVDGPLSVARLGSPISISLDDQGDAYIVDTSNYAIRFIKFDSQGSGTISTIASGIGYADGPLPLARFQRINQVLYDSPSRSLLVLEEHRLRRIVLRPNGSSYVETLAGSVDGFADGLGASARFGLLLGMAVDPDGICYLADSTNRLVRRVSTR